MNMKPTASYVDVINKLATIRGYGIKQYEVRKHTHNNVQQNQTPHERQYANIMSLNVNGLNKKLNNMDIADLYSFIHKNAISGIAIQEHNLTLTKKDTVKKSIKYAIEGYQHARVTLAPGLAGEKRTAVGGSGLILGGVLAKYTACSEITDLRYWGRYCGRKIIGRGSKKMAMISLYGPYMETSQAQCGRNKLQPWKN